MKMEAQLKHKTNTVKTCVFSIIQMIIQTQYCKNLCFLNYSNDYIYESDIPESFTFRNKILQLYTVQYLCNLKSSSYIYGYPSHYHVANDQLICLIVCNCTMNNASVYTQTLVRTS